MLKVEPRFRLDRPYKSPFCIQSLTSTNAVITTVNDGNGKPINVSWQRLSKTSPLAEAQKPWLGYSGKLRHCCKIRKTIPNRQVTNGVMETTSESPSNPGTST